MGGQSGVLCRYFLHGACKFGADCAFSHSLADSESQVCRFYLKGECSYGDRCRYQHKRPDWAGGRRDASAPGYAAPAVPRPTADDLAQQLPISRLRLGGQAPDAAGGAGGASAPPLRLPSDPFGSGEGWDAADDGDGAADDEEAAAGQQHWYGEEEEGAWGEHGDEEYWGGEEGEYGDGGWAEAEGWLEQDEAWEEQAEQYGGLQAPAPQPRAWALPAGGGDAQQWPGTAPAALRSLCMQWFSRGECSKGPACKLVHGDLCEHCGKHALHPSDPNARQQHLAECRLRHERLAARARSAAVECGICLEPVLAKPAPADRKFGLLTGCDHPFCLRCIRSWRQKTDGGADLDTALRTCPVCRLTSHYIVPSLTWPTSAEEKEAVVAGYKAKLSTVDCRYFSFGDGSCPFGTSCFYRHAYSDGTLEDRTSLRKAADEEGNVRVVQPVRLSDFIAVSSAGRRLGRRG